MVYNASVPAPDRKDDHHHHHHHHHHEYDSNDDHEDDCIVLDAQGCWHKIHILMVTILINLMITMMIINPPVHEDHGKVLPVLHASQVERGDPLPILMKFIM